MTGSDDYVWSNDPSATFTLRYPYVTEIPFIRSWLLRDRLRPLSHYDFEQCFVLVRTIGADTILAVAISIKGAQFTFTEHGIDVYALPLEGATVGEMLDGRDRLLGGGLVLVDVELRERGIGPALCAWSGIMTYDRHGDKDLYVSTCHKGSRAIAKRLGAEFTGVRFHPPGSADGELEIMATRVGEMGRSSACFWLSGDGRDIFLSSPLDSMLDRTCRRLEREGHRFPGRGTVRVGASSSHARL
eukprot:TRINITY_DN3070_c0_g3_i1.p1 TRINITY_DN3070_c0_g3~~TRINITY_DN3070_c0_g3_i1.p1  ORF type:complete len:244 (+),score=29.59 TRINITY_DN3070_c0_g3_i1:308-1039(+)